MWRFESSRHSQPVRRLETSPSEMPERPANGGVLRIGYQSPGSETGRFGSEIADSLRQIFEIFPFSGDSGRRPGSIGTAWRRHSGTNWRPTTQSSNGSPPPGTGAVREVVGIGRGAFSGNMRVSFQAARSIG